jgi:transcriptional regulator with XRE-family HTH domain
MNTAIGIQGASRTPFAHLLKVWRGIRKLSQSELSMASGVSQRQVSFIESGRARPSHDTVLRLAEALDIPLRERNALLGAAGFAALYSHSALEDLSMSPVREALDLILENHEPNPALLLDRQTYVLSSNKAARRLFGRYGDMKSMLHNVCGNGAPNLLRLTFHPQGFRSHILNWMEAAPIILMRARRDATAGGDEALLSLLDEITAYPGIPSSWQAPAIQATGLPVFPLEFAVGEHNLRLFTMVCGFGWPQDVITEEIRVESFFPADADSSMLLRELASEPQPVDPSGR